jgi:ABC-type arginine transport system permease subunit
MSIVSLAVKNLLRLEGARIMNVELGIIYVHSAMYIGLVRMYAQILMVIIIYLNKQDTFVQISSVNLKQADLQNATLLVPLLLRSSEMD